MRAKSFGAGGGQMSSKSLSKQARNSRKDTIPVGRYGSIEEFGNTCAFLCSQYAGFIVGQNILLDGGAVNSTI